MVVHTAWGGVPVYINVYCPVLPSLRRDFYAGLPSDFEPNSLHLVGGDFNLPLDDTLDTARGRGDHASGKAECIAWLTELRVADDWRIHHPIKRLYSGPGRINRLDYIFADHELVDHYYQDASYVLTTMLVTIYAAPCTYPRPHPPRKEPIGNYLVNYCPTLMW
ncbi:hypothetical protein THRCLA_23029 [Thraustotheca clavata]|uniref:Endonuclease/exonuclease/phosphatase domain-containing protein n=1 Tax=Thraustotheca clavata TaxID=74557 RepID=A0A1V9YI81_9STRA|nr:hypothetical protein THRCLA_23029 [Thraustotheca clavata]